MSSCTGLEDGDKNVLRYGGVDPTKDDSIELVPLGFGDVVRTDRSVDVVEDFMAPGGNGEEFRLVVILHFLHIKDEWDLIFDVCDRLG